MIGGRSSATPWLFETRRSANAPRGQHAGIRPGACANQPTVDVGRMAPHDGAMHAKAANAPATAEPPIRRHPEPVARVMGLSSMTLERPDPARAARFFEDFGLRASPRADGGRDLHGANGEHPLVHVVPGPAVALRGLTFVADAPALEALTASSEHVHRSAGPDAHVERVCLVDPMGHRVEVLAPKRQNETVPETPCETAASRSVSHSCHEPRVNAPLRLPAEPPAIRRLGHVALEVVDFDRAVEWYTRVLGLLPSDIQVLDDGSPGLVFLRCDRGPIPTEHHTIVLARSVEDGLSHAAFAVDDLDALAMGQRVLRERGWRHGWGIGRHLMGSQLFDYWRDPWGELMEHYADSDRHDAEHRPTVLPMTRDAMAQWGPPMPADFVDTRLTPRRVATVLRNLRTEPALTLRRVLQLKRAMAP